MVEWLWRGLLGGRAGRGGEGWRHPSGRWAGQWAPGWAEPMSRRPPTPAGALGPARPSLSPQDVQGKETRRPKNAGCACHGGHTAMPCSRLCSREKEPAPCGKAHRRRCCPRPGTGPGVTAPGEPCRMKLPSRVGTAAAARAHHRRVSAGKGRLSCLPEGVGLLATPQDYLYCFIPWEEALSLLLLKTSL